MVDQDMDMVVDQVMDMGVCALILLVVRVILFEIYL